MTRAIGLLLFGLVAVALSLPRQDSAPAPVAASADAGPVERSLAAHSDLESLGLVAHREAGAVARPGGVLAHVQARLLYDQDLASSALTLSQAPGGVVVVEGAVVTDEAKRRALELTRSTVGVAGIIEHIDVVRNLPPAPAEVAIGRPVVVRRRVLAEVATAHQPEQAGARPAAVQP